MSDIATSSDRRTFFLGVNTGYVTAGLPDDRFVEFYENRASPQLHCAIVGNVVVPGGFGSNAATPTLTDNGIWEQVATAIAAQGTVPGIQLATAWEGYEGSRKFVGLAGDQVINTARALVHTMGRDGIGDILDAFDSAAQMALDHGYGHVQVHAAHGYFLSLLVDARIYAEAERVLDRLAAMATRLATDGCESSIRISLKTGDAAFDADGREEFQDRIAALPFDFFDLSSGFYNIDKRLIYPSLSHIRNDRLAESLSVAARHPAKAFILSGRAAHVAPDSLPLNVHIGLCRDLIANANFLTDPAHGCCGKNKCHYFSRGAEHLSCALWEQEIVHPVRREASNDRA